ncbi:Glyoxylase, beta-lactamase superfamily II [Nocardioides exalbidus]|uniref:Glyoxylase, beta-lactamase superfamily II n=1 Tax=Nocardioides exalbidus TaxID=402596 RepID=A0A1H5AEJ5_9ACTN|nr:rhodanese-like domain-containing protein [Nocardioides exalbidus]SED39990.1 Glyoxylase, beta-lactamase superfamily II [Nocardioides exalbidus]
MDIIALDLPLLGNRTHLVHDGRSALVVDPPRSLVEVEAAADAAGVRIVAVAETHVHNDYVSGGLALSRRHRADYLVAAEERVSFEHVATRPGDTVDVGGLRVEVVATPGHTFHHQAFHVTPEDPGSGTGAVLTGGSLLAGTVGRTDLVDPALARHLARAQWASVRHLGLLPPATTVHPTHGFGSFCAGGAPSDSGLTIGEQAVLNPALTTERDAFVDQLVAGFGPIPRHYRFMASLNRSGAGARRPADPVELDDEGLEHARTHGAWLLDLRPREKFAAAHVPGSINVEHGDQFALWAAWVTPWGGRLVLLGEDPVTLETAASDLAQIGVEEVAVHVLAPSAATEPNVTYRRARWDELPWPRGPRVLLDVRHAHEVAEDRVPGSLAIPLPELASRISEVPPGEVWVHCRSGYRAAVAAGLLARAGRSVVHVDDDLDRAPLAHAEHAVHCAG